MSVRLALGSDRKHLPRLILAEGKVFRNSAKNGRSEFACVQFSTYVSDGEYFYLLSRGDDEHSREFSNAHSATRRKRW